MSTHNFSEGQFANDVERAIDDNGDTALETYVTSGGTSHVRVMASNVDSTRRAVERNSFERISDQRTIIDR